MEQKTGYWGLDKRLFELDKTVRDPVHGDTMVTRIMRVLVCAVTLVMLVGMLSGCEGQVGEDARNAVQAVGKLDSSVSVGINYLDYTSEVRDAKAVIDGFRPPGGTEEAIHNEVSAAMDFYLMAHEAWRAYDEGDWSDWNIADHWYDAYPHLEFELDLTPIVDDVRQEAWARAAEHVEAAREMLD